MRLCFASAAAVELQASSDWYRERPLENSCVVDSWRYRSDVSATVVALPSDGAEVSHVEGAVPDSAAAWLVAEVKVHRPERVCQTGFNYGLSAFMLLCAARKLGLNTTVESWDLGEHAYVEAAAGVLDRYFPGRH